MKAWHIKKSSLKIDLLIEDDDHKISLYRLKMDDTFAKIRTKTIKSTDGIGVTISLKELLEHIIFSSSRFRALASYSSERTGDDFLDMKLCSISDTSTEDITWYNPARYELYLSPIEDKDHSEIDISTFKINELGYVDIHLQAFTFMLANVYSELKDNGKLDNIIF